MKQVGFNEEMLEILSSMKGKVFKNILYEGDDFTSFGNVAIKVDDKILEITNREDMNGFDEDYESSHFSCKYVDEFISVVNNAVIKEKEVNEVIEAINIVTDKINIDEEDYHIEYDMAVEIITQNHKYTIARNYFYSEVITLHIDEDMDEIYSIEKVERDWQNEEETLHIEIERNVKNI